MSWRDVVIYVCDDLCPSAATYGAYGAVLFFHPSITRIGLADPWSFFRSVVPLHPARSLTRSWFCSFFGSCRRRKQMLASARSPVVMLMLILDVLRSVKQSRTIQISRSREFARHRERAVPLQGLPHWWRQTLPGLDDWRKAVRLRRPNELVDGVRQGSIVLFFATSSSVFIFIATMRRWRSAASSL